MSRSDGPALLVPALLLALLAACQPGVRSPHPAGPPPEFVQRTARGLAAARLEEWELARTFLAAAQAAAPREAQGLCNLGAANDRAGRDLAAAYWYRACLAAAPDAANAAEVRRAALRSEARSLAAALALWDRALALAPGDSGLHQRKAETLTMAGRADEARAVALALADPSAQADVLASVAVILGLQGDAEAARETLAAIADPQRRASEEADLPSVLDWTEAEFEEGAEKAPDTILDDWLRLLANLGPEREAPTAEYGRAALARGQAEGVAGLAAAAADLTEALADLQLTDRFWRRMP